MYNIACVPVYISVAPTNNSACRLYCSHIVHVEVDHFCLVKKTSELSSVIIIYMYACKCME